MTANLPRHLRPWSIVPDDELRILREMFSVVEEYLAGWGVIGKEHPKLSDQTLWRIMTKMDILRSDR